MTQNEATFLGVEKNQKITKFTYLLWLLRIPPFGVNQPGNFRELPSGKVQFQFLSN